MQILSSVVWLWKTFWCENTSVRVRGFCFYFLCVVLYQTSADITSTEVQIFLTPPYRYQIPPCQDATAMPTTALRLVVETSLAVWSQRPLGGALSELWGPTWCGLHPNINCGFGCVFFLFVRVIFSIICRIYLVVHVLLPNSYYSLFPDFTCGWSLFAL